MPAINEDMDKTIYDAVNNEMLQKDFYGYVREDEYKKHKENPSLDKNDTNYYFRLSNAFTYWYLTKLYPGSSDIAYKEHIVNHSYDCGFDAAVVNSYDNGKPSTIEIYQMKHSSNRLGEDDISEFKDIMFYLEYPERLEDDAPEIFDQLSTLGVFNELNDPTTIVHIYLVTTSELNETAQTKWDELKDSIESETDVTAKLHLCDMKYLKEKYFNNL